MVQWSYLSFANMMPSFHQTTSSNNTSQAMIQSILHTGVRGHTLRGGELPIKGVAGWLTLAILLERALMRGWKLN